MPESKAQMAVPRYYEIEAFRRSVNRKLWVTMLALLTISVLSLGLALIAFARPVPVVVFDNQGKPLLFEDTRTPRQRLTDVRVEYFTKEFVRSFVGVDSLSVEEDLSKSLAMMTPRLRAVVMGSQEEIERRGKYKDQNVRSTFSDWKVRIGEYDPEAFDGKVYLIVSGTMGFEPRVGQLEGEGSVSRFYLSQVVLQRVPVTEMSIHGLLVDFIHTRFFDTPEELKTYLLEKAAKP